MDNLIFNEKPIKNTDLTVKFHDMFYDYYLTYQGMPDGFYITSIGEYKVGFSGKHQLHKFIAHLGTIYENGVIPAKNIQAKKIPTLSEPVIRRLAMKVVENKYTDKLWKFLLNTTWESTSGKEDTLQNLSNKPQGPGV